MIFTSEKLSRPVRYGIGVSLAVLALGLQGMLAVWVEGRIPFLLFIPTLALTATLLGRGPALIVFITGLVYGTLMLPPVGRLWVDGIGDRISLLAYAGVGLFFVLLGGWVRTIAWRAAEAERTLFAERLHAQ